MKLHPSQILFFPGLTFASMYGLLTTAGMWEYGFVSITTLRLIEVLSALAVLAGAIGSIAIFHVGGRR